MSLQFQRKIRVSFTSEGITDGSNQLIANPSFTSDPAYDLKVTFNATRTKTKDPDTGTLHIYGLGQTERDKIDQISLNKPEVLLEAGYMGTSLDRVILGDVKRPEHVLMGVDWVTTVEFADGIRGGTQSSFNQSYAGKVKTSTILEDIFRTYNDNGITTSDKIKKIATRLVQGVKDGIPEVMDSFTAYGNLQDVSNDLIKKSGKQFVIQDKELKIIDFDIDVNSVSFIKLDTGKTLLNKPTKIENGGINASTLLNPAIKPGKILKIDDAFYGVTRADYSGDNKEGFMTVNFNARPIKL